MKTIKVTDVENSKDYTFQNSNVLGGLINQVEGFEYPSPIVSIEEVAGDQGAVEVNSKFGRRVCSYVYTLTCDVLDSRKLILAVMRQTGFLKLIEFTTLDDMALRFEAYVSKIIAPYSSMMKPIMIELSAPDWRFYSQTEHTTTINRNSSGVVTNAGDEVSQPVLRLKGPFTVATVTNLNTSDTITITETIIAGEYIDIDCKAQTIKEDDGTSRYSSATGTPDFLTVEPGDNTFQFTDTGGDVNTKLDVIFRDAYLGV
jgi:phage-related protein